jgi:hypothetical protein
VITVNDALSAWLIGFEFSLREVANRLYELRPDLLEVLNVFDQMIAA